MTDLSVIEKMRGGLIVSCQALPDEPLFGSQHMAVMAKAAFAGGACAIRANGPADISAIRMVVDLPIIGLYKEDMPDSEVRITPTLEHIWQVSQAGADLVAIDATQRKHPGDLTIESMVQYIHNECAKRVVADVSTLEEGLKAYQAGADFVATTLSGYTAYSPSQEAPDFELLQTLVKALKPLGVPVIAEGRINTPEQAATALNIGAFAVVVGSAITRPQWITARFYNALKDIKTL
jgi:N-acylglucosamine-6-phosphate 2-epimerase